MPVRSGYMPVKKALRPDVQLCIGDVVHEHRALFRDAVDVGRFPDHQTAVVDTRLHPADVVAHDEQDVGLCIEPYQRHATVERPAFRRVIAGDGLVLAGTLRFQA